MAADLREAVAPLRAQPDRSVLLFDFDGTLSPVVDDPAAAVALPGVPERLERLAASYRLVGAVSGRPVAFPCPGPRPPRRHPRPTRWCPDPLTRCRGGRRHARGEYAA